jgi:predicted membrane-bound mannosyltransferase
MTFGRLLQIRGWLAYVLAAIYLIAGTAGFAIEFSTTTNQLLWFLLLWGGGAIVIVGLLLAKGPSWTSAVLVCAGALVGGVPLLGTVLIPLAVAVLIALSVAIVRRAPSAA